MRNTRIALLPGIAAALLGGCAPAAERDPGPPPPPGWQAPPPPGTAGYAGPNPTDPARPVPGQAELAPNPPLPVLDDDPDIAFRNRAARRLRGLPGQILFVAEQPPQAAWRDNTDRLVFWQTVDGVAAGLDRPAADAEAQAALAARLIAEGTTWVIVDRRLAPWRAALDDRENRLLEQLCRGRAAAWFHPRLIGRTFRLYEVAPPFAIDPSRSQVLTAALRRWLAGGELDVPLEAALPRSALGQGRYAVGAALYGLAGAEHRPLLRVSANGGSLSAALQRAAELIRERWPALARDDPALPKELAAALPGLVIALSLGHGHAELLDRDPLALPLLVEPGADGLALRGDVDGRLTEVAVFPGRLLDRGVATARRLADALCEAAGLPPGTWRESAYALERFSTEAFLEQRPGGELLELVRGQPRTELAAVTAARLREARQQALRFLLRVQDTEGRFLHRYQPLADRWTEGNALEDHALITLALLHGDTVQTDAASAEGFRRALGQLLAPLRCEGWQGQRACFPWQAAPTERISTAPAGAAALTALVLIRLGERQPPLDRLLDATLRSLGTHLLRAQDPNGHFRQHHVRPGHPYYGCERPDAPGQILLALARLHRHSGDAAYREAFDRGLRYYDAYWAGLVARATADGAADPRLVHDWLGFVPWQVLALTEMHRHTGEAGYADRAIALQAATDARFLITGARAAWPDLAGGVQRAPLASPSLADALLAASRAAALEAAVRRGRESSRLRDDLRQGLRFLLQQQAAVPAAAARLRRPWMVEGGFFDEPGRPRMQVAHTAAALLAIDTALSSLALADTAKVTP